MKKYLGVLLGISLAVAAELWGFDAKMARAQTKPVIYLVCDSNNTLVQTVKTSAPVTFTASVVGPEGNVYWAIYAETSPSSCNNIMLEYEGTGSLPPGVNLEADTSHKPTLKVG